MVVGERREGGTVGAALVEVRALGCFGVTVDGRALSHADWQRLSAERLFKLLVVTPGHRVAREVAAETLWPDSSPETGRTNLRKALHFAHRALLGSDVLVADTRSVGLDAERLSLDLDRLTDALGVLQDRRLAEPDGRMAAARLPDEAGRRGAALETILELGPLELLPDDQYEDWLVGPRERLRSQWQRMAIDVAREARTLGRADRAHEIVDQLLDRDATDEAAHRLAIEMYAAEGRHHAVRRQFELCRSALRQVLDVEPSTDTLAAYQAAERRAVERRSAADSRESNPSATLVARRPELERIEGVFDRVIDGHLASLVIRGPAGIGKTRLLEEVGAYGRSAGWQVIAWQAVEALRVEAFAPLRIALASRLTSEDVVTWREPARSGIATLIPTLEGRRLEFKDRTSLVAALVAALEELARRGPLVFAIDDLPWLDESSLALLAALLAGSPASQILIAGTYRDDEPAAPEVGALVDQMRASGGLELRLGPLARRDVDALVLVHLGGQVLDPALGAAMFEHAGGNPLFSLELVRAGVERGVVRQEDGRWHLAPNATLAALPDSARRIAARRSAALPPVARELLGIAAELGSEIPFDVLSAIVPGDGRRVVDALDAALESGLIVESGAGYAFAHPLYRLAVRAASGPARRAATQLAIARALAGADAAEADDAALNQLAATSADPLSVAEHALTAAELGLRDALALAIAYGFAAGDRLVALHDRDGARAVLGRAIAVWRHLSPARRGAFRGSRAFIHLGHLATRAPMSTEVADRFREAIDASTTVDELAHAYDQFWEWDPYQRGEFERGRALLEEGLARLPASARAPRAVLEGDLAWTLVRMRKVAEALPMLESAAAVLEGSDDVYGLVRTLDSLGMANYYFGRAEEGLRYVRRAYSISLEAKITFGEILGNLHLGILLARTGRHAQALPMFDRAAELGSLTGERYVESLAAWGSAESADAVGDYDAARAARLREIEMLGRMGGNPHNAAMAHAHLANLAYRRSDPVEAEREADEARRLARDSPEPGYTERIERAIRVERWADLDT